MNCRLHCPESVDVNVQPTKGKATATIGGNNIDVKWIQLWAGGPKWAEYNMGASSATGYGSYFEWNSTDIATAQWGSAWCMPTKADFENLFVKCTCSWDNTNKGLLCTGKGDYKDNSIFLPAAGECVNGSATGSPYGNTSGTGSNGWYWSSTPYDSLSACDLYFDSGNQYVFGESRPLGYSVRAVLAE